MNAPDLKLYIVVPCYNEEKILNKTMSILGNKLNDLIANHVISSNSCILMVDDGSSDATWGIIAGLHAKDPIHFHGLKLAANRGHQNALLAGLLHAQSRCDAAISIDADLQDDINVFDEFIAEYKKGNDIVYGVRADRKSDSFLKRFTAELFYKILGVMGVKTIFNHADFRLMSSKSIKALSEYQEVNIYLRGLIYSMGFPSAKVYYSRLKAERATHYSLKKMFSLAWDGVTSFSIQPIRIVSLLGIMGIVCAVLLFFWIAYCFAIGKVVSGWASTCTLILFCFGCQALSLGCIGEYVGKIYLESKRRPKFLIEKTME